MNPRCYEKENIDMNQMGNYNDTQANYPNCACPPVYECPQERVCERYIVHEVPHVMPIHTKIVNHHIYKHSYTPCYTMSECDTCENVYDPCCKNF
jgi:hypothetical protein